MVDVSGMDAMTETAGGGRRSSLDGLVAVVDPTTA
jgi:hypothetical protein